MKETLLKIFGNTILFYIIVSIPVLIDIFYVSPVYGATAFTITFLVYAFVFRPITDGLRFVAIGKLQQKDMWKMFIPLYTYILHYSKRTTV
jgi:hypothetical protein